MNYFAIYHFDRAITAWVIGDIFNNKDDAIKANGGEAVTGVGAVAEVSRERLVKDLMEAHLTLLPQVAIEMLAQMKASADLNAETGFTTHALYGAGICPVAIAEKS